MKIFVKTLKDTHFEMDVKPEDTVADVKKNIEALQGPHNCPAAKQLLIYKGNVLENDTTLQDNKVVENSFIVIVLTKFRLFLLGSNDEGSSVSVSPREKVKDSPDDGFSISTAPTAKVPKSTPLAAPSPVQAPVSPAALPAPTPTAASALPSAFAPAPAPAAPASSSVSETGAYRQGVSNDAVSNFNHTVEQILDMGGGTWDRDTVLRALQAAEGSPESAVEYLYSGVPEQAGVPAAVPSSGPNANLQDIFPQGFPRAGSSAGGAGVLDFLRHSPKFQALRAVLQANPEMLEPMLQELGKQNPQVVRLIQEHHAEFLRLVNEPIEGGEENILGQFGRPMPQAIQVTPAEHEAIKRLEVMGFDRATVLEVYFACNKNEGLAANYLLDHLHEFED